MFYTSFSVTVLVAEACENLTTGSFKRNGKKYIYKEIFQGKFPTNWILLLSQVFFFPLKSYEFLYLKIDTI